MPAQTAPIPLEKLVAIANTCLCFNLRRATRAVTQSFDRAFQPLGLRATQFSLLAALAIAEDSGQMAGLGRLAEVLGMDTSTLSRNLRPLARDGLVEVRADPYDGRGRLARLTPAGRTKLAEAMEAWEQTQARLAAGLGPERVGQLLALLAAGVKSAGLENEAGGPG